MRIEFAMYGEREWWTRGAGPVTLCSRGVALPIRRGDRLRWRYGYYHSSQGMVSAPVPLEAWIESADGGVWRFLNAEAGDGYDDFGEEDRARLIAALDALSQATGSAVEEAEAWPPRCDRLVGEVVSAGVSQGEAALPWSEVPVGTPLFWIAMEGVEDPIPLFPTAMMWHSSEIPLPPEDRAELQALLSALEGAVGSKIVASGRWSSPRRPAPAPRSPHPPALQRAVDAARFFSCYRVEAA